MASRSSPRDMGRAYQVVRFIARRVCGKSMGQKILLQQWTQADPCSDECEERREDEFGGEDDGKGESEDGEESGLDIGGEEQGWLREAEIERIEQAAEEQGGAENSTKKEKRPFDGEGQENREIYGTGESLNEHFFLACEAAASDEIDQDEEEDENDEDEESEHEREADHEQSLHIAHLRLPIARAREGGGIDDLRPLRALCEREERTRVVHTSQRDNDAVRERIAQLCFLDEGDQFGILRARVFVCFVSGDVGHGGNVWQFLERTVELLDCVVRCAFLNVHLQCRILPQHLVRDIDARKAQDQKLYDEHDTEK